MHTKKRQEAVPPSARIDLAFDRKYNHVKTDPPKRQKKRHRATQNDTERQQTTKTTKNVKSASHSMLKMAWLEKAL